jgi:branched-chain amino acid transport system permease protein
MGTLVGPVAGAFAYLLLEKVLSAWTVYWAGLIGAALIALVLLGKRSLLGLVARRRSV